jgi:hypothetical protein
MEGGVWAIDAKSCAGKLQRIDKAAGFRRRVAVRRGPPGCTELVAGMAKQVEAIRWAIGEPVMQEFDMTVRAAICFVGVEWSLFTRPFALDNVWIG